MRGVFHRGDGARFAAKKEKNHWRARRSVDMALITCHFNPCGYARLRENYEVFAAEVARQGYELWTIELALPGSDFGLPAGPRMVRVCSGSVLWHKERMLNRLVEVLPSHFRKVAWVDHDVFFEGDNWLNAASSLLEDVPVAQLYQRFDYLDRHDGLMKSFVSAASVPPNGAGQPGGALAARRELWTAAGGLPDRIITGGGDSFLMNALRGVCSPWILTRYNAAMADYYERCRVRLFAWSGGRVGYLPGRARHRWHGDLSDRKYVDRLAILKAFDPEHDLEPNTDVMWELRAGNDVLREGLLRFFQGRREDG